jgi:hypothetical protein
MAATVTASIWPAQGVDLIYASKVDHRFDNSASPSCLRKTLPYSKHTANKAFWVEPDLMADI